jgi:hypothetical protein
VAAGEVRVGVVGGGGVDAGPIRRAEADGEEAAIAAEGLAERQIFASPPGDVGGIAEGADHEDAGSLFAVD